MKLLKKLAVVGFLGMTAMTSVACGLESAVEDAQAELIAAAKKKVAEKGFQSAVSGVTKAVVKQAIEQAGAAQPAAAPNYSPLAVVTEEDKFAIDETVDAEGGTITNKGEITFTMTYDDADFAAETKFDMNMNLTTTWTGMKFTNEEGKELTSEGTMTVTGEFHMAMATDGTSTFNGVINQKGSMKVDGTEYTVDIVVTIAEDAVTYTGTINGEPITGSFDMGIDDEETEVVDEEGTVSEYMSCSYGDTCTDFTGSFFRTNFNCAGGTPSVSVCATESRIGSCLYDDTLETEQTIRYYSIYEGYASTECQDGGGSWTPDNL